MVTAMEITDGNFTWDVDVGLLINLVKNFPHIYNTRHKHFQNKELKDKTWTKIADSLSVPVDDCMRIWRNMRDKYTRETRVRQGGAKSEARPQWEFYEAMEFLSPHIRRRRTLTRKGTFRPRHEEIVFEESEPVDLDGPASPLQVKIYKTVSPIPVKTRNTVSPKTYNAVSIKFSPEHDDLLDDTFEGPTEVSETEDSGLTGINVEQPVTVNMRYQTSEEAFGAYVAARLIEFSPEVRKAKKTKIFHALEDLEGV